MATPPGFPTGLAGMLPAALPGIVATAPPDPFKAHVERCNKRFAQAQMASEPGREQTRKLLDAQTFALNMTNLEARVISSSVATGAQDLRKLDAELHQRLVQQHEEMHAYVSPPLPYNSGPQAGQPDDPEAALLRFYAGTGWAAGCNVLSVHTGNALNLCVARQLDTLRAADYDMAPPRDAKEVELVLLDARDNELGTHVARRLDQVTTVLLEGL